MNVDLFTVAYVIGSLIAVGVAVLWICLPFAVFGTKDKLNQMIAQNEAMLAELRALRASNNALAAPEDRPRVGQQSRAA